MFDRLARQIGVLLRQQRPHDLRRHTLAHPAIARCTRPARGPNVMLMSSQQHALDYIEFPVADLAVAREFYGTVFGWRFNDYGPAYAGIIAADGQGEVGGLDATATPTPGGPLVLIRSADLAASAAAVTQAGERSWRVRTTIRADGGSSSPTRAACAWACINRRPERVRA